MALQAPALEPLLPGQLETFQTWIAAGGLYIQVQIQVQKPQSSRNAGTPTAMQFWDALLSQGYKSHTSQPKLSILNQFQSPSLQSQVLTLNPDDVVLQGPVAREYRMSEYRTSVCWTNAVGLLPAPPYASGSVVWWSGAPA